MARFLLDTDYASIIQTADLTQITEGTMSNLYASEEKAIAKMRSKLVQRYLVDVELGVNDAYSAATYYRSKERVLVSGSIYSVKEFDLYSDSKEYATNDIVRDVDGYVYTALQGSLAKALTDASYWSRMINITYTNTTYWSHSDNRYPLFIELAMDLALYNLYSRINPRQIPELRKERYREALDQLDAWASGTDTAEVLDVNDANQTGYSIRYGNALDKQNNLFI